MYSSFTFPRGWESLNTRRAWFTQTSFLKSRIRILEMCASVCLGGRTCDAKWRSVCNVHDQTWQSTDCYGCFHVAQPPWERAQSILCTTSCGVSVNQARCAFVKVYKSGPYIMTQNIPIPCLMGQRWNEERANPSQIRRLSAGRWREQFVRVEDKVESCRGES